MFKTVPPKAMDCRWIVSALQTHFRNIFPSPGWSPPCTLFDARTRPPTSEGLPRFLSISLPTKIILLLHPTFSEADNKFPPFFKVASIPFRFKSGGNMAPITGSHHHRSTTKQSQKSFKSRHATKGALKEQSKGKIHVHLLAKPF